MNVLYEVIQAIWFFLPAGISNAFPVVLKKLKWFESLAFPIDFGMYFFSHRITGDHKTWRGFVGGTLAAILVTYIQVYLFNSFSIVKSVSWINYSEYNPVVLGFLLGFGALFGDLVKSFIKRRFGKSSGQTFLVFDQVDYIIGGVLFVSFIVKLSSSQLIALCISWVFMHLGFSYLGWKLGIKEKKI